MRFETGRKFCSRSDVGFEMRELRMGMLMGVMGNVRIGVARS